MSWLSRWRFDALTWLNIVLLVLLLLWALAVPQAFPCTIGDAAVGVAQSFDEVREARNDNREPEIRTFLNYCGLDWGYPWCMAFYHYSVGTAYAKEGLRSPFPRNASVAQTAKVLENRPLDFRKCAKKDALWGICAPESGDLMAFRTGTSKEWVTGHAAMVLFWDGRWAETIEGNTKPGEGGDQSGRSSDLSGGQDGVYYRERDASSGWFQAFYGPIQWPLLKGDRDVCEERFGGSKTAD